MGPRDHRRTPQDDLFRNELANLVDQRHPLVKLAGRIDWSVFERERAELFTSTTGRPAAPPVTTDRRAAVSAAHLQSLG